MSESKLTYDLLPYDNMLDGVSPDSLNSGLSRGGAAVCVDCGNSINSTCQFHALIRELIEIKKHNAQLRNAIRVLSARDKVTTIAQTGLAAAFRVLLELTDNKEPVAAAIAMLERSPSGT